MILVTIGTQAPFNRLIKAVDEIAEDLKEEVIVQGFDLDFEPQYIKILGNLPTHEFNALIAESSIVISHAGMGNIISAMQFLKPIIILPRMAKFGEHRNDHQLATAKKMASLGYVTSVYNIQELKQKVLGHFTGKLLPVAPTLGDFASDGLINSIKDFMVRTRG
jgi:UDP-N-acetylglucosamine transferase subunit ALG13